LVLFVALMLFSENIYHRLWPDYGLGVSFPEAEMAEHDIAWMTGRWMVIRGITKATCSIDNM